MRIGGVFFKIYSVFLALTVALALAFYFMTLPWMRQALFDQERRAAEVLLNNTVEVVKSYRRELDSWRTQMLDARKALLRERVRNAARLLGALRLSSMPETNLKDTAIRLVASMSGAADYLWLADEQYQPVYHPLLSPLPRGARAPAAPSLDETTHSVARTLVDHALQNREGFIEYLWPRRPGLEPERKLAFVRHLPEWHWVLGSGLYISDIDRAVDERRAQQLEDIRALIKATPIAAAGYIYIFDGRGRMIVHPDKRLEGRDVSQLKDPATGQPLVNEIIAAARDQGVLEYKWNRPDDPDNYHHWKIAWVRHLPEADWYIATSVYKDDLYANVDAIIEKLVLIVGGALLVLLALAAALARRFSQPLERMARVAKAIAEGSRSERLPENRRDEVGTFAVAFNRMVERLHGTLSALEGEVAARTRQLSERVEELKERARDERLINQLLTYLQGCESEEEVFRVVSHLFEGWAPESAGLIWRRLESAGQDLVLAGRWGLADPPVRRLKRRDCFVARQGIVHDRGHAEDGGLCDCMGQGRYAWSICLPIKERGDVIVVIQVMFGLGGESLPASMQDELRSRLTRIVEPLGLALQNLHLRERLRDQSIRDGLTGLYNRRFLDDRLDTEISRCERNQTQLAVLLIDVDHFKPINDTWGHPVGDRVLTKLAALMLASVRESDLVCRYGGEEFVMVLPDISPEQAIARAEALRKRVAETAFVIDEEGNRLDLTVSIGVAWYPDMGHKGGQVIRAADIALYRAKRSGRNRVEVAREVEQPQGAASPEAPAKSSPPAS